MYILLIFQTSCYIAFLNRLMTDVPALIKEAGTRTDFQAEREQDHQHPLEISDKSQAGTSLIWNQRKLLRKIEILKKKLLKQKNEVKAAKRIIKKSHGRHFTNKDKLLALSIFKKSPKAYNFLRKLFTLPSKRTLQDILKLITIRPGLNPAIFDKIKDTASKLGREDKLCQIMFDEMSVSPSLHFDTGLDEICGFEDFGEANRNNNIADHVILFIIKGIKAQYKQPVCFAFCKSATKAVILKNLLKKIIEELFAAGLIVISTVCDQSTINNKVINDLLEETKANYYRKGEEARELAFEIANKKIYPLFDPPHLLKGIRNNLITKDLHYIQDGKKKIAKWDHLKLLLNIDSGEDDLRMCNKLTEAHVLPEKIPKMKVKHAAQVFSQRVSSALRFCAKHKLLPDECADTADVLLLFDHLFDSFNGSSYKKSHKTYKSCLKTNSEHFMLWDKALPILRSMQFKRETKKRDGSVVLHYEQVPSIKNWIHNINSMKHLWNNKIETQYILYTDAQLQSGSSGKLFFMCKKPWG
ncbi:unnamed protein product [Euphydryas editha]|uniref:Transposable element P transposase n=1 Tax=Euphydryas editha TaxID=104508 RepID=A0AAU9V6S4_EUPED|nr:unnamed protein product [Euphydryas editha]